MHNEKIKKSLLKLYYMSAIPMLLQRGENWTALIQQDRRSETAKIKLLRSLIYIYIYTHTHTHTHMYYHK